MVIILLVVLGLCFGSFTNALVWRLRKQDELADRHAKHDLTARQLSITKGRSMCVHCHHELAAKDLVPIISYLWLRGKCRYCRQPIQDTPLPELLTPLLFVGSYVLWPGALVGANLVGFVGWLVCLVGFVALALYDIRWYELPHKIVLPLIGFAVLVTTVQAVVTGEYGRYGGPAIGAAIIAGLFGLLYTVSPKQKLEDGLTVSKWIGGGDITLGFLLGWLVGSPGNAILLIFLASLLGTLVALPLLLAHKATRTSHLPFGPYLLIAAIIVKFAGPAIIAWYGGLLSL